MKSQDLPFAIVQCDGVHTSFSIQNNFNGRTVAKKDIEFHSSLYPFVNQSHDMLLIKTLAPVQNNR